MIDNGKKQYKSVRTTRLRSAFMVALSLSVLSICVKSHGTSGSRLPTRRFETSKCKGLQNINPTKTPAQNSNLPKELQYKIRIYPRNSIAKYPKGPFQKQVSRANSIAVNSHQQRKISNVSHSVSPRPVTQRILMSLRPTLPQDALNALAVSKVGM